MFNSQSLIMLCIMVLTLFLSKTEAQVCGVDWQIGQFIIKDVIYSNGQSVAIGENGAIFTNTDEKIWLPVHLEAITWGNNQFVVVGLEGNILENDGSIKDIILTSADAITWSQTIWDDPSSSNRTSYFQDVVWGNNKFVIVGKGIFISQNAETWKKVLTLKDGYLKGVTWSGEQFVAVGQNGLIFTSPDGITWTQRTQITLQTLNAVAWGNNQFVAVGYHGIILSSPDAITWTVSDLMLTSDFEDVSWDGKQFMVVFAFDAVPIGLQPISGDWDGNGGDNVGLYDAMQHKFYLRNSNTAGPADIVIDFNSSQSNWLPVAGDFNSDCITTVGLYDPLQSKFHIRNSNSSGAADAIISVTPTGGRSWLPIASR